MTDICLVFEVHQPIRLDGNFVEDAARGKKPEELFDTYFNSVWNREILKRVASKCYYPTNDIILKNIDCFKKEKKKFKVAYSISGVFLEQCELWEPDVIESFKQLGESGCVEFIDQTYYHSLASLFSADHEEFIQHVLIHKRLMRDMFNSTPIVFENTESIYNNSIAKTLEKLGYKGVFTEGAERILGWRSPNYVYRAAGGKLKVFLRNYRLSDDIAFRFSARDWAGWPLTADKYAAWLAATSGQCINIFIDYETFGEHQWPETGIHDFLCWLPGEVLKHENLCFVNPSELLAYDAVGEIDVGDFNTVSWADVERSTNAWLGNDMQRTSYAAVKGMGSWVRKTGNRELLRIWRLLQVSDHIYYMYTAPGPSGVVHGYFSQQFPTDAFNTFMRVISNFQEKIAESLGGKEGEAVHLLRVVPPARAFHFHEDGKYVNLSAHSLDELKNVLKLAPEKSILFHVACKHFEKWVRFTIGDGELADEIAKIEGESAADLRQRLYDCVKRRLSKLKSQGAGA